MPENLELKVRDKIYDDYISEPSSVNTMLHITDLVGGIKQLSDDENQYLLNSKKVINSEVPMSKKDIYKSASILIAVFFKEGNQWAQFLKCDIAISTSKLLELNEVLMQNIFGVKSMLNKKNILKPIQVKSYFSKTGFYEFQVSDNPKIHPFFKDTEDNKKVWNQHLEFFKGKIPIKEPR